MSIPLIQKPEKDDINTSIIAIKRNIERINMLLGLVDSGSDPDLSGLATKQELQDAITELTPVDEVTVGNMQSVTSNAVSKVLSYSTTEQFTGRYWISGTPIYQKTVDCGYLPNNGIKAVAHGITGLDQIIRMNGMCKRTTDGSEFPIPYVYQPYSGTGLSLYIGVYREGANLILMTGSNRTNCYGYVTLEYIKTSS